MQFTPTSDQAAVVDAIDRIAREYGTKPTDFDGFALQSSELEQELENGQYFDIAAFPEMGPVTAALAVERLARSPYAVEVALSMLVRHSSTSNCRALSRWKMAGPVALWPAGTVLVIDGERRSRQACGR